MLYGGSIAAGNYQGKDITIQDVFEAVGAHAAGRISEKVLGDIERAACPGAGACGGQFTANTMATAFEALGISVMGTAGPPALSTQRREVAHQAGRAAVEAVRQDMRPSRWLTRESFENAIACVNATGGSTNAVIHLLAVAAEAGIELSLDDFDRVGRKTPLLADLKPAGRFVAPDMHAAGGTALVLKRLLAAGRLHGEVRTITGRTMAEEVADATETPGQQVISAVEKPLKPEGGLVVLWGNLAPEGSVLKIAGTGRLTHRGPARVFEREEDAFAAVQAGGVKKGDVVVIRYEGPRVDPDARDARRYRGAGGLRPRRGRRAPDRRPLQWGNARHDGGPRRARGGSGWADRRVTGRRRGRVRRGEAQVGGGVGRGGARGAAQGLEGAHAAL